MKFGIISLLLLSAQISFAQVFTIREIYKNNNAYVFPWIESTQRPGIAEKMNSIIQTDFGGDLKAPFENISSQDEYAFQTGVVDERLLVLIITGSHSGMGSHDSRTVYNFDSRTGEAIDLDKMFGADGQVKLKKTLCKYWKEAITANLNTEPFVEEYKDCLAKSKTTTEVGVWEMMMLGQSVRFRAGECLDGSDFEADRTNGPYDLSFGQLLPMLTSYGYSVFVDKTSPSPFQTLLRGTIDGKYPISLTLFAAKEDSPPGTLGGIIVYDRLGQPLTLSGTKDGQSMIFHELDASNNPLSDIAVTWSGTQLSGTFINLKSKKQMSFVASPVVR